MDIFKKRNANIIINKVKNLEIVNTPVVNKKYTHAFYKLYLTINTEYLKRGKSRAHILRALNSHGVNASFGSSGRVFAEKAFSKISTIPEGLPNSSKLEKDSIMLPVHPTLTLNETKKYHH